MDGGHGSGDGGGSRQGFMVLVTLHSVPHSSSQPPSASPTPSQESHTTLAPPTALHQEASLSSLPPPHLELWQRLDLWSRCLSLNSRCNCCYGPKRRKIMINLSWGRPKVVKSGMTLAKSTNLKNKHKHQDIAQGIGINANEEARGTVRTSCRVLTRRCAPWPDVGIPGCLEGKETCWCPALEKRDISSHQALQKSRA